MWITDNTGRLAKWMIIAVLIGLALMIFITYFVVTPKNSRLEWRPGYGEVPAIDVSRAIWA
jgi:hypothetical protein